MEGLKVEKSEGLKVRRAGILKFLPVGRRRRDRNVAESERRETNKKRREAVKATLLLIF